MKLQTILRPFHDAHAVEGTTTPAMIEAHRAAVREARVIAARRQSRWEEIDDDLVPRGRGLLVSAETDLSTCRTAASSSSRTAPM